jgi:dTDP-3-amino-3,4,6-trideoxy-alpha-D-glucose transaminase
MSSRIPFARVAPAEDAPEIAAAVQRVVESGWYILGAELQTFEHEFAGASAVDHAVGVGNGTDAIALILRALGIGRGDEVITTPLSAAYSALAVLMAGATPVFADIDADRLTLDPAAAEAAIGPRTAALLPVHLYGQSADVGALAAIARRHNLALIEDCCQAHFGTADGKPVGSLGVAGAFSFYPTKNLAALGDAGAIVTNDGALAERLRRLRNGGQTDRYHHQTAGINSRLDEIQAAILRVRLRYAPEWTARRRALARVYRQELAGAPVTVPREIDPGHVYHLFPVLSSSRDSLCRYLSARGIETLVHYPIPIHRQEAFRDDALAACPKADAVCDSIVSLPFDQRLSQDLAREVGAAVREFREVASRT